MLETRFRDRDAAPVVLLVDDDPSLLRVTARRLRDAGCNVTECGDGASAAAVVDAQPFDLVLSDIDMPGLSGIELLMLLRQRHIDVSCS
jgi:adenylate cyclase